jgi:hypothetical protein
MTTTTLAEVMCVASRYLAFGKRVIYATGVVRVVPDLSGEFGGEISLMNGGQPSVVSDYRAVLWSSSFVSGIKRARAYQLPPLMKKGFKKRSDDPLVDLSTSRIHFCAHRHQRHRMGKLLLAIIWPFTRPAAVHSDLPPHVG